MAASRRTVSRHYIQALRCVASGAFLLCVGLLQADTPLRQAPRTALPDPNEFIVRYRFSGKLDNTGVLHAVEHTLVRLQGVRKRFGIRRPFPFGGVSQFDHKPLPKAQLLPELATRSHNGTQKSLTPIKERPSNTEQTFLLQEFSAPLPRGDHLFSFQYTIAGSLSTRTASSSFEWRFFNALGANVALAEIALALPSHVDPNALRARLLWQGPSGTILLEVRRPELRVTNEVASMLFQTGSQSGVTRIQCETKRPILLNESLTLRLDWPSGAP